ncbi:MAG: site-2 protease family protein [Candidatus Micrarchaeia archaeon]
MAFSPIIGKIFGIEIELHWSFLLLLVFTLLISFYVFMLIVLLFICVLFHELAHSVTSLRNGVNVRKITLLPIGGVSIIDNANIEKSIEFNIAIAGPIMSLFLAGIFGMLATLSPSGIITQTMQIMFEMNLLLGVFNLLPAFPMDGGRVFRSYLQRKKDYYSSTMLTVKASKFVMGAILFGTFVFLEFDKSFSFSYREFVSLWNLIIVMFLYSGAQAEGESAKIKKSTAGLNLSDAITKHFILVNSNMKLSELYNVLLKKKEHNVITKLGSTYARVEIYGKISRKDALYVKDVSIPIPSMQAKLPLADALSLMGSREAGMVAVIYKKKFLGVATASSIQTIISLHMLSKKKTQGNL